MEIRPGVLVALVCCLHLAALTCAEIIDTRQPIYRAAPEKQDNAYFGYTLVLHQVAPVAEGNRLDALESTRIVVSAPRFTVPGANSVPNTGAVFTCPINMGPCTPLEGNQNNEDDARLYDSDANNDEEEKSEQFLGGSMASNEEGFVVCAHRYVVRVGNNFRTPVGVCYATTNRALRNFDRLELCPVRGSDNLGTGSAGVCMLGQSSVITESQNDYTFGFGAPGYFSWRGLVIRRDPSGSVMRQDQGGPVREGYQGFAMTAGYFLDLDIQDYAVSVPRSDNYFGRVTIVTNDDSLSVVSQPDLMGQQVGEYYGHVVLSANLDGDDFDELLVSAPMYRANTTQPETGRVYLYRNNQGNIQFVRTIEGFGAYTRFGYAMTNLGDISGDGYDDIAIGAPFAGVNDDSSGTVYIYHSTRSQLLTMNPQQIIVGSELSISGGVTDNVRGFGSALASGVDVDANTYNDLAIGSFLSQDVFLLRTRPLATVTQTITATPQIVMLESLDCALNGEMYACFNLQFCMTYSGSGLSATQDFQLIITADVNNIERRVFFENPGMPTITVDVTANIDQLLCRNQTAYVERVVLDRFNPIVVDFSVMIVEGDIMEGDGNLEPEDFSNFPVVSASGASTVQIETFKNCSGAVCIPDLQLAVDGYRVVNEDGSEVRTSVLTLGEARNVVVESVVVNVMEDAFQATITISAPTALLEISRSSASLNSGRLSSLNCPTTENVVMNDVDFTSVTCNIGNPFAGPDTMLNVFTTIIPRAGLVGDEDPIPIMISVASVNAENPGNEADNEAQGQVQIRAAADVFLDTPGLVTPEQISYSNNPPNDTINNATQLGPAFTTSFVVRNTGPSTVRRVSIIINWPLNRTGGAQDSFFLYPAQVTTSGTGATATCMNTNINPIQLSLADFRGVDDEEGQNIGQDDRKRRRRRRNAVPYKKGRKLRKRQADDMTLEETETRLTNNVTVNCADPGDTLTCVRIECTILGLEGNGNARFDVIGLLDERYFANTIDRFTITPTAEITVLDGDFLVQQNEDAGKTSMAFIRVIPAEPPVTVERRAVPWWVIFLAVLAAVVILAVIGGILWGLGFFRRRKHEELKQKKEELQNLDNNAKSPDDAVSTDNIVGGDGTNL